VAGELHGHGAADTTAGAGNDGDFAFKSFHWVSPVESGYMVGCW
jgi:hypothetical protein